MELQKNTDLHPIQVLRLYSDPPDVFSIDRILYYKKLGMYFDTYNLYLQYKYTSEKQKVKKESLTDFLHLFSFKTPILHEIL